MAEAYLDALLIELENVTGDDDHGVGPHDAAVEPVDDGGEILQDEVAPLAPDPVQAENAVQGGEQLFVDLSVYKQNQQMRCLMSRKLGRMNPLIISSISRSKYKEFSKESFFASLLTHGDSSDDKLVKIETSATTREIINREISSSKESPWIEIDKVITNLIKPSGRISGWTHRTKTNTYCYSIVGNAFCRNVNREHSHSKVYYMYCFSNHTLWQQCFSSHCEGFKSEPIEIPDFSWLSDNDSWSD